MISFINCKNNAIISQVERYTGLPYNTTMKGKLILRMSQLEQSTPEEQSTLKYGSNSKAADLGSGLSALRGTVEGLAAQI
jgi:hypothetical protein